MSERPANTPKDAAAIILLRQDTNPSDPEVFWVRPETRGIIPFVWLGARLYGAEGVIAGWGLGAVIFGVASIMVCFRVIGISN